MHSKHSTKIITISAALGLLFGALALAAMPSPVRAADDEEETEAVDEKFIRGILEGLGLERDGKKPIDYHERPPLVVPITRDLVQPEEGNALASSNPAWPRDPDIERRKQLRKHERERLPSDESSPEWTHLLPDQLGPRGNRRATPSGQTRSQEVDDEGRRLSPSQLGYKGGIFGTLFGRADEEKVQFTGEPARGSLTDPPAGYQTPSPDQPYGAGKAEAGKPADHFTKRGEYEQ